MTSFNLSHLPKTPPLNIVTLVVMFEYTNWVWDRVTIQFITRRETGFFIYFTELPCGKLRIPGRLLCGTCLFH